jgi:DNA-binding SARP family transcriptional activator
VQALSHLRLAGARDELASLLASRGRSLLRAGLLDAVRDAAAFLASRTPGAAFLEDLLGEACRLRGDFAAAVGHFESALATPSDAALGLSGQPRAEALQGLAYSLMRMGAAEPAEATAQRALEAAGDGNPGLVARILNTLSIVKYRGERIDEAIAGWQEALLQARRGGDEHLTRMIAHNLGLPHAARGDFRRATECFRILTAPHNPRVGPEEGTAYLNLARIAILRGEHESAARQLDDAWEISRKWHLRALAGDVLEAQGTLLRETGDLTAADAKYADARAVWIELGQLDLLDSLGEEEAIAAARRGETERAERMAAEIVGRARATGRPDAIASALLALGEIRAGSSEPGSAVAILEEAANIFASLERGYQECAAWLWLGLAEVRLGGEDAAREAVARALRLSARFDYEALVVRVASADPAYRSLVRANPSAPQALAAAATAPRTDAVTPGTFASGNGDLVVRILGPVEVYRDVEAKIPAGAWRLKRAFKVFCFLAAARNHRATKDRIAEALWGEVADAVIEKNFHPTISFLRRALNHGHAVPKNFILYEGGVYSFNPEYRFDVDLERFDRGLGAARHASGKGDAESALKAFDDALALYRGPFLEDEDDHWTAGPRAHYESLMDAALRESAELWIRAGAPARAVERLERLVERNPADQAESIRLMRVLGSHGRRAGVEREYRRLQRAIDASRTGGLAFETVRAFREILAKTSE